MNIKRSAFVTAGLMTLISVGPIVANDLPSDAHRTGPAVQDVLDRHIQALGGEQALREVRSVTRSGELRFESDFTGKLQGTVSFTIVNREKLHRSSQLGAFSTVTGWDGEVGWENGPQGLRKLQDSELDVLIGQADLFFSTGLWRHPNTEIQLLEDTALDGKSHRVLRFDGGGLSDLKVYLDSETYLVSQIVFPMEIPGAGSVVTVTDFWDYREHQGLMMPDVIGVSIEGFMATESRLTETKINGAVDDAMFSMPQ